LTEKKTDKGLEVPQVVEQAWGSELNQYHQKKKKIDKDGIGKQNFHLC
jgi:hypothetical protein